MNHKCILYIAIASYVAWYLYILLAKLFADWFKLNSSPNLCNIIACILSYITNQALGYTSTNQLCNTCLPQVKRKYQCNYIYKYDIHWL